VPDGVGKWDDAITLPTGGDEHGVIT